MDSFDRIDSRIKMFFQSDAEFEREIGAPAKITDQWRNRGNQSYKKRIPQIAKALQTTSAYLLCETDDPNPINKPAALDGEQPALSAVETKRKAMRDLVATIPDDKLDKVIAVLQAAIDAVN